MSEDEEITDMVPEMQGCGIGDDLLLQILRAKDGDPNKFQSFWEMDEEGIDEATMEEIQKDPAKKILWAAENDERDVVLELLELDSTLVHSRDDDGYSPLHRACYNGHTDMVQLLLKHEANIEAKTNDGWYPIHSASRWNQADVVSILLQNSANINAQTNSGQTALHLAASDKECRQTLEILLMDRNVEPSLRNSLGESAYDICKRTSENCLLFEITEESVNKCKRNVDELPNDKGTSSD